MREGTKVRIHCPSARRYPSFYAAFHGRAGVIVKDDRMLTTAFEKISIPSIGEINVDRRWLRGLGDKA